MRDYKKRVKAVGKWAADRGYDCWDIFIGKQKWCELMAVTEKPIELMLKNYPTSNIDWNKVRAISQ